MKAILIIFGIIYFVIGAVITGIFSKYHIAHYIDELDKAMVCMFWPIAIPIILMSKLCKFIINKIEKL